MHEGSATDPVSFRNYLYCGFNGFQQTPIENDFFITTPKCLRQQTQDDNLEFKITWNAVLTKDGNKITIQSHQKSTHQFEVDHCKQSLVAFREDWLLAATTRSIQIWRNNMLYYVHNCRNSSSVDFCRNHAYCVLEDGSFEVLSLGCCKQVPLDSRTLQKQGSGDDFKLDVPSLNPIVIRLGRYKIQNVLCGVEHILLLSEDGTVFSYGSGSRGQLGHGTLEAEKEPRVIEALEGVHVKELAAGGWHSVALTTSGDINTWGWNESGQLGFLCNSSKQDKVTILAVPQLLVIEEDIEVQHVSCGSRHTCALSNDGRVWSWGWNQYGQLGHGDTESKCTPTEIKVEKHMVTGVWCGGWGTILRTTTKSTR